MPRNYVRNPDDDEELKDFQTKVLIPKNRKAPLPLGLFYNFQAKQLTVEKFPGLLFKK